MIQIEKISFSIHGDGRGSLIAVENNKEIPFEIKRVYYIYGTNDGVTRGLHAHKKLKQVAICVSGSCTITLFDGFDKKQIFLDKPSEGLIIKEMIWREMHDFSEDCVLLVLASELYDEADYIRDYNEFMEAVKNDIYS